MYPAVVDAALKRCATGETRKARSASEAGMSYVDFSRAAGAYDRRPGGGPLLPIEAARDLVAGVRPGAAILDIGAGTGRVSIPLSTLGFPVVALDPAAGMNETLRAKAAGGPLRMIRAEGGWLTFQPASF